MDVSFPLSINPCHLLRGVGVRRRSYSYYMDCERSTNEVREQLGIYIHSMLENYGPLCKMVSNDVHLVTVSFKAIYPCQHRGLFVFISTLEDTSY
jgi:hypothetical protein